MFDARREVEPVIAIWPNPVRPTNADWPTAAVDGRRDPAETAAEEQIRDLLYRVVAAGESRVPIAPHRADQPVSHGQFEDLIPAWSDPPTPLETLTDRIYHAVADAPGVVAVHLLHLHQPADDAVQRIETAECLVALDDALGPPRIYAVTAQAGAGGAWMLTDWRRSLTRASPRTWVSARPSDETGVATTILDPATSRGTLWSAAVRCRRYNTPGRRIMTSTSDASHPDPGRTPIHPLGHPRGNRPASRPTNRHRHGTREHTDRRYARIRPGRARPRRAD